MAGQISEPTLSICFWFFFARQRDSRRVGAAQRQRRPREGAVAPDGSQVRALHVAPRASRRRRRPRLAAAAQIGRRRGSRDGVERGDVRVTSVTSVPTERQRRVGTPSRDARGRSPGRGRCGRRRERHVRALRRRHNRAGSEELSRGPRRVRLGDAVRVASPRADSRPARPEPDATSNRGFLAETAAHSVSASRAHDSHSPGFGTSAPIPPPSAGGAGLAPTPVTASGARKV